MRSSANANLASAFWFLALLHRPGYDRLHHARKHEGSRHRSQTAPVKTVLTFDVKGKAALSRGNFGSTIFPYHPDHFFVLVDLHVSHRKTIARLKKPDASCYITEGTNLTEVALPWSPKSGAAPARPLAHFPGWSILAPAGPRAIAALAY